MQARRQCLSLISMLSPSLWSQTNLLSLAGSWGRGYERLVQLNRLAQPQSGEALRKEKPWAFPDQLSPAKLSHITDSVVCESQQVASGFFNLKYQGKNKQHIYVTKGQGYNDIMGYQNTPSSRNTLWQDPGLKKVRTNHCHRTTTQGVCYVPVTGPRDKRGSELAVL